MGDVAAREEVWEVAGQLVGLALSVALLQALDSDGADSILAVSPAVAVIVLWLTAQLSHIFLRCGARRCGFWRRCFRLDSHPHAGSGSTVLSTSACVRHHCMVAVAQHLLCCDVGSHIWQYAHVACMEAAPSSALDWRLVLTAWNLSGSGNVVCCCVTRPSGLGWPGLIKHAAYSVCAVHNTKLRTVM